MSGDTHFRLFPSILRPLRPLRLPSILRPSPSPPPTSFLSDVNPCLRSVRFPVSFLFFPQLHYSFRFVLYFRLFCLLIVALMFISICHRVSPVSQLYFIYRQCCTLAGLHPFLLGSPARCANYCSLLCQIYLFRISC